MRYFLVILFLIVSLSSLGNLKDTVPNNPIPTQYSTGFFRHGVDKSDSGHVERVSDTAFIPRWPGMKVMWQQASDTSIWFWTGQRWLKTLKQGDVASVLASNGLSLNGDTIQLGQLEGDVANPAVLLNPRQIPLNGNNIRFSGDTGNVIIGNTTQSMNWQRIGRVQINSNDTTHPLLTIGPSPYPASVINDPFPDYNAQLVIGLADTIRHATSQQNLKAGGLIVGHKNYYPIRTTDRLGATRYTIQSFKESFATDTVDWQCGNPGGDLVGSIQGEHVYRQFPGYSGRTIYISDSCFGTEPHVFNANTNITSTFHSINNGGGSKIYFKGWYGMYNGQLLMGAADTVENLVGYSSGAWSGGSGFYVKRYYNIASPWQTSSAYGTYHGIWDAAHPLVPAPNRYNWLGHRTGIGPDVEFAQYMLDVDGNQRIHFDSTNLTADNRSLLINNIATFNTTSSTLNSYGAYINNNSTRSSGSNNLSNYALRLNANNGQLNYALKVDTGRVIIGDGFDDMAQAVGINYSTTSTLSNMSGSMPRIFQVNNTNISDNDSLTSFPSESNPVLNTLQIIRAKDSFTLNSSYSNAGHFNLYLQKLSGYLDTTTYIGKTTPNDGLRGPASAVVSAFNMSQSGLASTRPIIATGFWSSFTATVNMSGAFNQAENVIWINTGAGQNGSAGTITNGYGLYVNAFGSNVTNKYGIYQAGTLDTNYFAGKIRIPNLVAQTDTSLYKPTVVDANGNLFKFDSWGASAAVFTANNGLNKSTPTNVQLGGDLVQNTIVGNIGQNFGITFNRLGTSAAATITAVSSVGTALNATTTSGTALVARSNSGLGGLVGINPSTTNTFDEVFRLERPSTGTATNGIGGYMSFTTETSDGSLQQTGRIGTVLTDVTTGSRTASMDFWVINSAVNNRKMSISGPGQLTLDGYPALTQSTDTTNHKPLAYNTTTGVVEPMQNWFGGGGGAAAGSNTEVIWNNAGAYDGTTSLTWDETNTGLTITRTMGVTQNTSAGFRSFNTTAATSGNQQMPPDFVLGGEGFATTPVASQPVVVTMGLLPVQGASQPSSVWRLRSSINGGAFVDILQVASSGILTTSGSATVNGNLTVSSSATLSYSGRSIITSPSNGNIRLTNSAQNDFGLLQFGGTTSSFFAIKRNGTTGQVRFADDSGFGGWETGALTTHGTVTMNNNPTGLTTDLILVKGTDSVVRTIAAPLNGSATLDFGSTAAGTSTDLTITVTGAVDGDVVSLGVPNGSTLSNGCFTAWVSAANTVTVRFTNNDLVSSLDPASGTFKVKTFK